MLETSSPFKGTILLVDDEVNILNSLKRIFVPLKYKVFTANGGSEGLEILEKNPVDIVISDMRMPEMDGAEFLKIVTEKWPDMSRVLLTGYADINSAVSAINDGQIDYYLQKPWQQNELEKIIDGIMSKRVLMAENKKLQELLSFKNEELLFINNNLEALVEERTFSLEMTSNDILSDSVSLIQVLSSIGGENEVFGSDHSRRVAYLSKLLAESIGLPEEEVQTIEVAGMLHAIGKIALPHRLISKPYTDLTQDEKEQLKQYPLLGSRLLMPLQALRNVALLVETHRESVNGNGYPNKLSGPSLSVGARILSLVVDYLEMQKGLLTADTISSTQALQIICDNTELAYDLSLIDFFKEIVTKSPDEKLGLINCISTGYISNISLSY